VASAARSAVPLTGLVWFSPRASTSVSNDWSRDVRAAPRSQIFSEPVNRKVGSWESLWASLTSSYPARQLYTDCRSRPACGGQVRKGQLCVLPPGVGQVLFDEFAESQTFVQLPHQNQAAACLPQAGRK
jgi:hypothetical protein